MSLVPVSLSADLDAGAVTGIRVAGQDLVLWRDEAGVAHAWDDRCPHRGMRMSFGFVRGGSLNCLYHGWQYGKDGQCSRIPAHPDLEVPKTIRIPSFPVIERAGIVWVSTAPDASLALADPGPVTPLRSLRLPVSLAVALNALKALPTPDAGGTVWTAVDDATGFLTVGPHRLLVACHESGPNAVALHVVLLGEADAATRVALSRWLAAVRLSLASAEEAA
ncbi:Rieske (2Fe-2S) protein [Oryzibacter oryziterrae]|uniref:Rieske (2Fe-2S) protein n=1 Tax=Oryzibacter oryziterrae TaxID=2766474 RepID=UPI001F285536|nr:Rieske (2Fe-2S) protein [Oryzibacter oryziterrae]